MQEFLSLFYVFFSESKCYRVFSSHRSKKFFLHHHRYSLAWKQNTLPFTLTLRPVASSHLQCINVAVVTHFVFVYTWSQVILFVGFNKLVTQTRTHPSTTHACMRCFYFLCMQKRRFFARCACLFLVGIHIFFFFHHFSRINFYILLKPDIARWHRWKRSRVNKINYW